MSIDTFATINIPDSDGLGTTILNINAEHIAFAELQTQNCICEDKPAEWYDPSIPSVEDALKELIGIMQPDSTSSSITEEEVRDIVRTELIPVIEHDVEDTISGIFSKINGNPSPNSSTDYQMQVASGKGHPKSAVEAHNASIEWNDEPAHVHLNGITHAAENKIENAVYRGTYRAMSRFQEPADETEIEEVHRLRGENLPWKYIAQKVYFEREGVALPDDELCNEVKRLQAQHRREYPKSCKKTK